MSDSLLIRLTDDWIRYMQEFDVENLALITTPSFTFYGIDENQNVTTIPKTEFLRRFKDQVKPVHPRSDIRILRRDIKRAETVEVVADVTVTLHPSQLTIPFRALYTFSGDKIATHVAHASATEFEQLGLIPAQSQI